MVIFLCYKLILEHWTYYSLEVWTTNVFWRVRTISRKQYACNITILVTIYLFNCSDVFIRTGTQGTGSLKKPECFSDYLEWKYSWPWFFHRLTSRCNWTFWTYLPLLNCSLNTPFHRDKGTAILYLRGKWQFANTIEFPPSFASSP